MGDGAVPEVFTKVPGPTDFSLTPPQPERIDVTTHDDAARTYLQGLGGEGELTSEFMYDPAQPLHLSLRDKMGEANPTNFELELNSGTIFSFAATVSWTLDAAVADAEKMAVTWAISGAVSTND
jgi:hypothetical protein